MRAREEGDDQGEEHPDDIVILIEIFRRCAQAASVVWSEMSRLFQAFVEPVAIPDAGAAFSLATDVS